MVKLTSAIITLILLASFSLNATTVTANLDKNPIMLDEAFILTLTIDEEADSNAFDSSVLLKDFVVGNTSVSSQTQIINFKTSRSTSFKTTLFPKKTGRFTIPGITINGVSSNPIELSVIEPPSGGQQEQRDYFVTAELSSNQAYVQQHVRYIVKLYMANTIESGSLQTPQMQGSDIEQLGEDKQYSEIINGKRFQVIERQFVVIPQASGNYVIQPPIFSGSVIASGRRQSFGFFNRTRNITRRGPSLELVVQPIPAEYSSEWLPAEYAEITEEWSNDGQFIVGEPITRTVSLTVAGQKDTQLPSLKHLYPPTMKTYPNQPALTSVVRNGQIVSQRKETIAVIPSEIGQVVMPGIDVEWYNVNTQRIETASIPARTVRVSAPKNQTELQTSAPVEIENSSQVKLPNADNTKYYQSINWYLLVVCILLLIAWIVTLVAWRRAKQFSSQSEPTTKHTGQEIITEQTIIKAIRENDLSKLNTLLLQWMNMNFDTSHKTLQECMRGDGTQELKKAHTEFMRNHYGKGKVDNADNDLINAITNISDSTVKHDQKGPKVLEPMYMSN